MVHVNSEEEISQGVMLDSGVSSPVNFTIRRNEPDTCSVYVDSMNEGSFMVSQFADSDRVLYISGSLTLIAFVIVFIYIVRRRKA